MSLGLALHLDEYGCRTLERGRIFIANALSGSISDFFKEELKNQYMCLQRRMLQEVFLTDHFHLFFFLKTNQF